MPDDRYTDGFLDGWAEAAATLRARFTMTPREPAADATLPAESPAAPSGHSDPPENAAGSQEAIPHEQHAGAAQEILCGCYFSRTGLEMS